MIWITDRNKAIKPEYTTKPKILTSFYFTEYIPGSRRGQRPTYFGKGLALKDIYNIVKAVKRQHKQYKKAGIKYDKKNRWNFL